MNSHNIGDSWYHMNCIRCRAQAISSGLSVVWMIAFKQTLYLTDANNLRNDWQSTNFEYVQISVSGVDNKVWAVKAGGRIFRRTGVTDSVPAGRWWEQVPGSLTQVSVGLAGVWGVDEQHKIYYRNETGQYDGQQEVGSNWLSVPGNLSYVSSGNGVVWGAQTLDSGYRILIRQGICTGAPTGTHWTQVDGDLKQISVDTSNNAVWGVDSSDKIFKRNFD